MSWTTEAHALPNRLDVPDVGEQSYIDRGRRHRDREKMTGSGVD